MSGIGIIDIKNSFFFISENTSKISKRHLTLYIVLVSERIPSSLTRAREFYLGIVTLNYPFA